MSSLHSFIFLLNCLDIIGCFMLALYNSSNYFLKLTQFVNSPFGFFEYMHFVVDEVVQCQC